MKIGVISDTHGFLDPRVLELFQGVAHILHAGDIGSAAIIVALEAIAPVTAVLGNNDAGLDFKETESIRLAERRFLVHHIVDVTAPDEIIRRRLELEQADAVVFGHTHKPFAETVAGTLYINPGYAGKPRFRLHRSVAFLHCNATGMVPEFRPL